MVGEVTGTLAVRCGPAAAVLALAGCCCSDDTYQWTGRVAVQMDGSPDRTAVLDVIAGAFDDREGYDSAINEQTGDPRLLVTGLEGAAYVGRFDEASHLVTLASASRCLALREGENSYDTY